MQYKTPHPAHNKELKPVAGQPVTLPAIHSGMYTGSTIPQLSLHGQAWASQIITLSTKGHSTTHTLDTDFTKVTTTNYKFTAQCSSYYASATTNDIDARAINRPAFEYMYIARYD